MPLQLKRQDGAPFKTPRGMDLPQLFLRIRNPRTDDEQLIFSFDISIHHSRAAMTARAESWVVDGVRSRYEKLGLTEAQAATGLSRAEAQAFLASQFDPAIYLVTEV